MQPSTCPRPRQCRRILRLNQEVHHHNTVDQLRFLLALLLNSLPAAGLTACVVTLKPCTLACNIMLDILHANASHRKTVAAAVISILTCDWIVLVLHLQSLAISSTVPTNACTVSGRPADMQGPAVKAADLSAKERLNVVLQSTFPYVECILGLPRLEVFQVQVPSFFPVTCCAPCSWLLLVLAPHMIMMQL